MRCLNSFFLEYESFFLLYLYKITPSALWSTVWWFRLPSFWLYFVSCFWSLSFSFSLLDESFPLMQISAFPIPSLTLWSLDLLWFSKFLIFLLHNLSHTYFYCWKFLNNLEGVIWNKISLYDCYWSLSLLPLTSLHLWFVLAFQRILIFL